MNRLSSSWLCIAIDGYLDASNVGRLELRDGHEGKLHSLIAT